MTKPAERTAGDRSRRPDLFIVGAPKSGTTSMYEYLRGHPEVYMAAVKEPFYFAPDVVVGPRARLRHPDDEAQYLALFEAARGERRLGEASTNYLASHVAPSLIRDFQPDARIVAMLRNPVEMVYALHNERVSHGVEPLTDFAAALAADDDRRAGRRLPDGCTPLGAVYRDTAMYGAQLERWLGAFSPGQVHAIVFEEFAADPAAALRGMLRFLDVDDAFVPADFAVHNPSHRLRGGPLKRVVESRPARWTARTLLPRVMGQDTAARLTRRFRHSRLRRRPVSRLPLAAELRRGLEADFAADVALLGRQLGRDLADLWFGGAATTR